MSYSYFYCTLWHYIEKYGCNSSSMNLSKIYVFQTVEEVSFAANGITAEGIKAFDGVLQSNIVLKTLDLSGNPIGDEGIKVSTSSLLMSV